MIFMNETLDIYKIIGGVFIFSGVYFVTKKIQHA
jgi:drug/metabolite transporter (DMT)-like permease